MRFIIDTHTLIWWTEEDPRLGDQANKILNSPTSKLIILAIVLCEFYYYLKKTKQTEIYPKIYQKLEEDQRITLEPLTPNLVSKIPHGLEMHDGLIAAHCLENEGTVILSHDQDLKSWGGSRVVWD